MPGIDGKILGALLDGNALFVVLAVLGRVGAAAWVAPFLGGKLVPASVKTAVALALALLVYPSVLRGAPTEISAALAAAIVVKEVLVGAALGFVAGLVFWAAEAAGRLVDTTRGASLGEVLLPQSGAWTSPLGDLYLQVALVLFLSLGGHRMFIAAVAGSYEALPLATFPRAAGLQGFALLAGRLSADLLVVALSLSAPVVAALFLADVVLGLINRFTPSVGVFFVAMPLKAWLGIALLALVSAALLGALPPLLAKGVDGVGLALRALGR